MFIISELLKGLRLPSEEEAQKRGEQFCSAFGNTTLQEACRRLIDEAILLLQTAAAKCSKPVKGGMTSALLNLIVLTGNNRGNKEVRYL